MLIMCGIETHSGRCVVQKHTHDYTVYTSNVFPFAGTCINNTGVFMFKKGCFELGATIYPVVIKVYDCVGCSEFVCGRCSLMGMGWLLTSSLPKAYLKCRD